MRARCAAFARYVGGLVTGANQYPPFGSSSTSWQASASTGTTARCRLANVASKSNERDKQSAGLGQQRRSPHRLFGHLTGRLFAGQLNAMCRLLPDRLGFLIEIDEHADLGPQHVRIDRCRNEVDRAERIALCQLAVVDCAVMKMIGVCSERFRSRMRAAVSKPSISGMFASSRITAKS